MSLETAKDSQPSDSFVTIPDVPIAPDNNTVNPNQVRTGVNRGAQVVVGDDGNPQVLTGPQNTFGNGFFVAKEGTNVITNTNPANLIFNSNQNVFKIVSTGSTTITTLDLTKSAVGVYNNVTVTKTIPHGLNFIPIAIVVYSDGVTYFSTNTNGTTLTTSGGAYGYARVDWSSDITNFYLNASTALWILTAGSVTLPGNVFNVKYYLLQETAN